MHVLSATQIRDWQELSDEDIVARVIHGQIGLFEILIRRHNERLYRTARAVVRNDAEAEDVMQQAYVNAYTHLRQFDGRSSFATWLTRIAIHEGLARLRRWQRDGERGPGAAPREIHAPAIDPERLAFGRELQALLEGAVMRLPDSQREVFMLRDVEGLSTSETAACLQVSDDVVKTRLSRARAALRRTLFERAGLLAGDAFSFQRPRCDRTVTQVMQRIA